MQLLARKTANLQQSLLDDQGKESKWSMHIRKLIITFGVALIAIYVIWSVTSMSGSQSPSAILPQDTSLKFLESASIVNNDYSTESWMKLFANVSLWDLMLPGSHNSCAFQTKEYFSVIEHVVETQDISIYEQLKIGIRALDIRVSTFQKNEIGSELEYWCSHTMQCVPLGVVFSEIKQFLDEYPSEVVVMRLRQDGEVYDLGYEGLTQGIDLNNQENKAQILKFITDIAGNETFIDQIDMNTTVGDLVDQNQRILLLLNFESVTNMTYNIREVTSWFETHNSHPEIVSTNCKAWVDNQDNKQIEEFRFLEHLITPTTDSWLHYTETIAGIVGYGRSLQDLSIEANCLLAVWLDQEFSCQDLKKVNTIITDFVDPGINKLMIDLNVRCLLEDDD